MHLIKRIEVEGFWDTHKITAEINPDVTFFIGINGTGKTTLINLIAAALTADFVTLEKLSFKKITISLAPDESNKRPTITVSKTQKKERLLSLVEYRIRTGEGDHEIKYSLDENDERVLLRRMELRPRHYVDYYRHFASALTETLSRLVPTFPKWPAA